MKDADVKNAEQKNSTSNVGDWRLFGLNDIDGAMRKPDSLFAEAVK